MMTWAWIQALYAAQDARDLWKHDPTPENWERCRTAIAELHQLREITR